jgi:hypothetical protein
MKKVMQQTFLIYFCVMTSYALWFTMVRTQVLPFIPWEVLRYHYGMMAPYQGYTTYNVDLYAEGRTQHSAQNDIETWEPINLEPYYPTIPGTQIMYRRLRSFSFLEDILPGTHGEKYRELATLLLEKERQKGHDYEAVRLTWQEWPMSPEGFYAGKNEQDTVNYFITVVP